MSHPQRTSSLLTKSVATAAASELARMALQSATGANESANPRNNPSRRTKTVAIMTAVARPMATMVANTVVDTVNNNSNSNSGNNNGSSGRNKSSSGSSSNPPSVPRPVRATTAPVIMVGAPPPPPPASSLPDKIRRKTRTNMKHRRYDRLLPEDRDAFKRFRSRAKWLDGKHTCCCCLSVGVDPLVGLLPVIGDFAGVILSTMLVYSAMQAWDLPRSLVSRMAMNIAIDALVSRMTIQLAK